MVLPVRAVENYCLSKFLALCDTELMSECQGMYVPHPEPPITTPSFLIAVSIRLSLPYTRQARKLSTVCQACTVTNLGGVEEENVEAALIASGWTVAVASNPLPLPASFQAYQH